MAKKAKSTPKDLKTRIIQSALTLAVRKGWNNVSLRDIATSTKISLSDIHDYFEDRADIIAAYARTVDRAVMDRASAPDKESPHRDRIFDVLMDRFDVLNEQREGVQAILKSFKTDPKQAVLSLPHLGRSMTWMLECAGIDTGGVAGALRITGLTAIYLKTLYVWCDDETDDLAKTMAALDKNLSYAEKIASTLGLEGDSK